MSRVARFSLAIILIIPSFSCSTKKTTTQELDMKTLSSQNIFRSSSGTIISTTFVPIGAIDTAAEVVTPRSWRPIKRTVTSITAEDTTTTVTSTSAYGTSKVEKTTTTHPSPSSSESLYFLIIVVLIFVMLCLPIRKNL